MGNKGQAVLAGLLATLIIGTGVVTATNLEIKKQDGEESVFKMSWTEQSKTNGKLIKCKFLNKGNDYCDSLYR